MPAFYAWFIKRDHFGKRTHHIHRVERDADLWDRLYFRDYLRKNHDEARRYRELTEKLAQDFPSDRAAYTRGKIRVCSRRHETIHETTVNSIPLMKPKKSPRSTE